MKNEEWEYGSLSKYIELVGGGTPKTSIPEYWNGEIPWLSVVDFSGDMRWVSTTEKRISKLGLDNSSTKLLRKDDLIISARGTVGELAQLKTPMAFNQSCYGIRTQSNLSQDYLYYLIKYHLKRIKKNTHGAVFDTITRETFNYIDVFIPPDKDSVDKIATILTILDKKIHLLHQQNKTLENMAQTLYKHWFVDYEFPDENGNPYKSSGGAMDASELGEIPRGWSAGALSHMVDLIGGGTPKTSIDEYWNGEICWYSVVDCPSGSNCFVINTEKKITESGLNNSSTKILDELTTIISARGTVGKLAIVGKPMAMNQSCYGVKGKEGYHPYFIYHQVQDALKYLKKNVHGAVFDTITRDTFDSIEIPIPELDIVSKYEDTVAPLMSKIRNNCSEIQTLTNLRDTLLPKLMSGEIEVK